MTEIWKPIEGYEGIYEVSDQGRVRNVKRGGRLLSCVKVAHGYLCVSLYKDGKQRMLLVHRLVALAFIPNPENKEQVNHKDLDKTNNTVGNLEWVTRDENLKHAEEHRPSSQRERNPSDPKNRTVDLWHSHLQELREGKGMTQEELAEACCVRLDTIKGIEAGTKCFREVSANVMLKLAWALSVSPEALVDYDVAEGIRREKEWHSRAKKKKHKKED